MDCRVAWKDGATSTREQAPVCQLRQNTGVALRNSKGKPMTKNERKQSGFDNSWAAWKDRLGVAGVLVLGFRESFLPADLSGLIVPLFLALTVQIAGQGLIVTGLGHTRAAIAGVLVLVQPVVAAGISWQLFDEPLAPLQAGGGFLILIGILIAQRRRETSATPIVPKPITTFVD